MSTKKKAQRIGPWIIGENYFIRTVTMYYTGRLALVTDQEIVIEEAAWIADTGRFGESMSKGVFSEIEPYPNGTVILGRGALIDATIWPHDLPRNTK